MAIRDKMRTNAASVLQPGETIQQVVAAQAANPYWAFLSYWILLFKSSYRVVVVTDRRIVVCQAGRMSVTQIKGVLGEFPRTTQIGPASGIWYKCLTLGDPIYIHKRFHKDVAEADAAAAATPASEIAPPPPTLPTSGAELS
jgi:hypothetical protein